MAATFGAKDARSLGLYCDESLEQLIEAHRPRLLRRAAASAFAEAFLDIVLAEFLLEGPNHGIPSLDPNVIPLANVGNGDYYGFYIYPPAQAKDEWQDPVVEYDHETPCIEFCSPTLSHFLEAKLNGSDEDCIGDNPAKSKTLIRRTLSLQPGTAPSTEADWANLLPTKKSIDALKGDLARWLEESPPPEADEDLLSYERTWVRWWTKTDYEEATLLDYGVELYGRLGWSLPLKTLESQAEIYRASTPPRNERLAVLWANNHPPSDEDIGGLVARVVTGEHDPEVIFETWSRLYNHDLAAHFEDKAKQRESLGNALMQIIAQSTDSPLQRASLSVLAEMEFHEAIVRLPDTTRAAFPELPKALEDAKRQHALDREQMAAGNDWSEV